jgi:hypothetical protein
MHFIYVFQLVEIDALYIEYKVEIWYEGGNMCKIWKSKWSGWGVQQARIRKKCRTIYASEENQLLERRQRVRSFI